MGVGNPRVAWPRWGLSRDKEPKNDTNFTHQGCERLNMIEVLKERLGRSRIFWYCCEDFELPKAMTLSTTSEG